VLFSILAALSRSFEMMLVARVLQGVGSAASRFWRFDCPRLLFRRRMARVMSPVVYCLSGGADYRTELRQLIMLVAPWPFIFVGFALFAVGVIAWVWIKLPETLHPEDRRAISFHNTVHAFKVVLTTASPSAIRWQ